MFFLCVKPFRAVQYFGGWVEKSLNKNTEVGLRMKVKEKASDRGCDGALDVEVVDHTGVDLHSKELPSLLVKLDHLSRSLTKTK